MQSVTKLLQNNLKSIMNSLKSMAIECKEIYDTYWKTDANTEVSGLSSGTDPATVETHLTKDEYTNGITFCQELNDFFQNGAVTTTDFKQTIVKVQYGSAANLATALSAATEAIGTRLYNICIDTIELYKLNKNLLDLYFDNEVSDAVTNLDNQRVIYGSEMTKSDLVNAITLIQEFNKMIDNTAAAQADYASTIAKWERLDTIE